MSSPMTGSGSTLTAAPSSLNVGAPLQTQFEAVLLTAAEVKEFLATVTSAAHQSRTWIDVGYQTYSDYLPQLRRVLKEFGWETSAYEKIIKGKKYVVLKGRPGLRKVFRGTKYSWTNPKIVQYGMGRQTGKLLKGSRVTLVILSALNVAEAIMSDDHDFIDATAQLTTDIAKTAIASIAAAALASVVIPVTAPIVVAVGASIVLGIAVGFVLDEVDASFGITKALTDWMRVHYEQGQKNIDEAKREARRSWSWCNSPQGANACMRRLFGGF